MKQALERRGVPADEVDVINPHGTSTPVGDKREAEAIWTVFGDRASASREHARDQRDEVDDRPHDGRRRRVRGVRHRHVRRQPVRPGDDQLPRVRPRGDVWVFPETRPMEVRYALSNNIGLGGHNGAVIFKR